LITANGFYKLSGVLIALIMIFSLSTNAAFAIDSPKKQLAAGVAPKDVVCKAGRVLAILDGVSVCVKQSTAQKLEKRWNATLVLPEPALQKTKTPKTTTPKDTTKGSAIQGSSGGTSGVVETIPASSGSIVNFYITDDDLNTSPSGVDIISTAGLVEFTINGVSITGPDTMTETGPNTGKFYLRLDLPDEINGNPITQNDIIRVKYNDQSDATGESRVSVTSIPLSKTFAQMQSSGGQRIGHAFSVTIYEPDANLDSDEVDRISLSSIEFKAEGGIKTTLANPAFDANSSYLLETGKNTGTFSVTIKIPRYIDGKLVDIGAWYEMTYVDTTTPSDTDEKVVLKGKIG
jgi:hypothetical protein